MNGILLINKPAGWTSHDVVAKIRGILATESRIKNQESSGSHNSKYKIHNSPGVKVGHTGTLDPFATGLLVLVLGKYTKRAGEFSKLDKVYEAELTLGATSTTGDIEGEIKTKSVRSDQVCPSREDVEAILEEFLGEIEQTPPAYSAVKIGGQRAYKLVRQGKQVKLEPRQVKIYELRIMDYEYPKLRLVTKVSSGTYIRSLAADIGAELGTGAYLSALRRTQVGNFKVENALEIEELSPTAIKNP